MTKIITEYTNGTGIKITGISGTAFKKLRSILTGEQYDVVIKMIEQAYKEGLNKFGID
jgi:ABC-type molybdate transport system substrate-binding protein